MSKFLDCGTLVLHIILKSLQPSNLSCYESRGLEELMAVLGLRLSHSDMRIILLFLHHCCFQ